LYPFAVFFQRIPSRCLPRLDKSTLHFSFLPPPMSQVGIFLSISSHPPLDAAVSLCRRSRENVLLALSGYADPVLLQPPKLAPSRSDRSRGSYPPRSLSIADRIGSGSYPSIEEPFFRTRFFELPQVSPSPSSSFDFCILRREIPAKVPHSFFSSFPFCALKFSRYRPLHPFPHPSSPHERPTFRHRDLKWILFSSLVGLSSFFISCRDFLFFLR